MRLGEPVFSEQVCLDLEQTYRCPVWLTLRLTPRSDVPQSLLLGELPILTARDTLIIKGQEWVPIGQLLLAPGIYFERTEHTVYDAKNEARGRKTMVDKKLQDRQCRGPHPPSGRSGASLADLPGRSVQ